LCKSIFHHCDKISEINNLREDRFILAHGFRGFSPWLAGSIALRPVARQKYGGKRAWWRKAIRFMRARK
jgi:hypothetical protein